MLQQSKTAAVNVMYGVSPSEFSSDPCLHLFNVQLIMSKSLERKTHYVYSLSCRELYEKVDATFKSVS